MTTIFRSLVDKDNDASNNSLYSVFKALNAQGIHTAFFFLFFFSIGKLLTNCREFVQVTPLDYI